MIYIETEKDEKEVINYEDEEISCVNEVINIVAEVINNVNEIIKNVDEEILSLEEKIILIIQNFPDVTIFQLMEKTGRSKSSIERVLKNSKRIIRVGSRKNGYWEVLD
jgi:predicted HTH transcriptional regulator